MDRPFAKENARERERLRTLVSRITDEELSLPLGAGWTISAALAHVAFWDQRSLVLLQRWKKGIASVSASPIDIDVANDAILPICLALPPRVAAQLAISCAEAIDRELEEASSNLISEIESLGGKFRLYRSEHRKLHLDQIESLIER